MHRCGRDSSGAGRRPAVSHVRAAHLKKDEYGRTDVERIYIMWGMLILLFVVAFIIMSIREGKLARPDEAAVDPMFRRNRPARVGGRARRTKSGRGLLGTP